MKSFAYAFGLLLGRILISTIFILAAVGKIANWEGTAQYMASKGMTMIPFFLIGAIIIEFFGGLALFFGFKTRIAAALLLLFLIPVTVIFHDFWNQDPAARELQMILFLKNLAIFGGLLYVATIGAGKISIDGILRKKEKETAQHHGVE